MRIRPQYMRLTYTGAWIEQECLCVAAFERDISRQALCPLRRLDGGWEKLQSLDPSARPDSPGEISGRSSNPATDIQDAFAFGQPQSLHGSSSQGRQLSLKRLADFQPGAYPRMIDDWRFCAHS